MSNFIYISRTVCSMRPARNTGPHCAGNLVCLSHLFLDTQLQAIYMQNAIMMAFIVLCTAHHHHHHQHAICCLPLAGMTSSFCVINPWRSHREQEEQEEEDEGEGEGVGGCLFFVWLVDRCAGDHARAFCNAILAVCLIFVSFYVSCAEHGRAQVH